jgi:hypothetical protein
MRAFLIVLCIAVGLAAVALSLKADASYVNVACINVRSLSDAGVSWMVSQTDENVERLVTFNRNAFHGRAIDIAAVRAFKAGTALACNPPDLSIPPDLCTAIRCDLDGMCPGTCGPGMTNVSLLSCQGVHYCRCYINADNPCAG